MKKIQRALDIMKTSHETLIKHEGNKHKNMFAKHSEASARTCKDQYKESAKDFKPHSSRYAGDKPVLSNCCHLTKFHPSNKWTTGLKKIKTCMILSNVSLPVTDAAPNSHDKSNAIYYNKPKGTRFCENISSAKNFSTQTANSSVQKTNAPPRKSLEKHSSLDKTHLDKAINGSTSELTILKKPPIKEEEMLKKTSSLSEFSPADVLRCRYLRLSENNISYLLQQCKDSGLDVEIHPHMKESDINLIHVISPKNLDTVCL